MKRVWVLVIALAFLIGAAGCGSGDSGKEAADSAGAGVTQKGGNTSNETGSGAGGVSSANTNGKAQDTSATAGSASGTVAAGGSGGEVSGKTAGGASGAAAGSPQDKPAEAVSAQQPDGTAKNGSEAIGDEAALWVTQDFSSSVLLDKQIAVNRNVSVLDIVKANLEVDTAYGGGFINAINGLQSGYTGKLFGGKKMDWFYWVNGIMVAEGAGDYIPMSGDRIWWDYHDWGSGSFVTAVVGAYPQPFVNGFDGRNEGTLVAYAPGSEAQAEKAAGALRRQGAPRVTVSALSGVDPAKRSKMTVVVGLWPELEKGSFFADLNENSRKTGIYVNFATDGFTALDYERNEAGTYKAGTGAIVATGRGLGDRYPLWLVTGVDTTGLNSAVNIICDSPAQLSRKVGVLVTGGRVKAIPE